MKTIASPSMPVCDDGKMEASQEAMERALPRGFFRMEIMRNSGHSGTA